MAPDALLRQSFAAQEPFQETNVETKERSNINLSETQRLLHLRWDAPKNNPTPTLGPPRKHKVETKATQQKKGESRGKLKQSKHEGAEQQEPRKR